MYTFLHAGSWCEYLVYTGSLRPESRLIPSVLQPLPLSSCVVAHSSRLSLQLSIVDISYSDGYSRCPLVRRNLQEIIVFEEIGCVYIHYLPIYFLTSERFMWFNSFLLCHLVSYLSCSIILSDTSKAQCKSFCQKTSGKSRHLCCQANLILAVFFQLYE